MSQRIQATLVERPETSPEPWIDAEPDDGGDVAQSAFAPLEEAIVSRLREMLERDFNDPDIFFLEEEEGFPQREEVSGSFYLGDRTYESEDGNHRLSLVLHCLDRDGEDYVGMEMFVYLASGQTEPEFEEHFQSSAI